MINHGSYAKRLPYTFRGLYNQIFFKNESFGTFFNSLSKTVLISVLFQIDGTGNVINE